MSPIPKTFQDQFLGLDFSYSKTTLAGNVDIIFISEVTKILRNGQKTDDSNLKYMFQIIPLNFKK